MEAVNLSANRQPPGPETRRSRWLARLPWAALFTIVFALHLPGIGNYFDNDDAWNYVLEAELALNGFESAFVKGGNYLLYQNLHRLIPDMSWIPRYALFDLWMPGWKLPSVVLHALNSVLVGLLALSITRRVGHERLDAAILAGLLYGLSPVHAQPVSWIGGTYDLFLGAFTLSALLAFDRGRRWLAMVFVVGACMSKEQGVLIAPVLGLLWLCLSRGDGLRAGLRQLAPSVLGAVAVFGLRKLQMAAATVTLDPMLTRGIEVDSIGLVHDAPLSAFSAVAFPLREFGALPAWAFGASGAGLVGLAALLPLFGRPGIGLRQRLPILVFCALSAVAFMVPVAIMREFGKPLGLEAILFNDRYLMVSHAFVSVLAGCVLLSTGSPTRRIIAVLLTLVTFWSATNSVALSLRGDSPAETLVEAISLLRGPSKGGSVKTLHLLTNHYREETFRVAVSRWVLERTGVEVHWVQRGIWRVLMRQPDRRDGLDFLDLYVRARKERFDPSEVDPDSGVVMLLEDASPAENHSVTRVTLPTPGARASAVPAAMSLDATFQGGALSFTTNSSGQGSITFSIGSVENTPRGWRRRAYAWLPDAIDAANTVGFRITYTATARREAGAYHRAFQYGYLELHWTSQLQNPDLTWVVMPIVFDGQKHVETLWVDIDPIWRASGGIGAVGVHPLDRSGEIVIHGIDALVVPKRRSIY